MLDTHFQSLPMSRKTRRKSRSIGFGAFYSRPHSYQSYMKYPRCPLLGEQLSKQSPTPDLQHKSQFRVHLTMTAKLQWYVIVGTLAIVVMSTACNSGFSLEVNRSPLDRLDTLQSGGIARTFEVHLPADYETNSSPVVILFHGPGGSGLDRIWILRGGNHRHR